MSFIPNVSVGAPTLVDVNGIVGPAGIDPNTGGQAVIVSAAVLLQRTAPQFLNRLATPPSQSQETVSGENSPIRVIMGRDRLGPQIPTVIDYNGSLVLLLVWGRGNPTVDAIEEFGMVDGTAMPAGLTFTHYLGDQSAPDPTLVAAFAAKGQSYTQVLAGISYTVAVVAPGTQGGFPRFAATIRGIKVRSTEGGTRAWSDHWAYLIAEYITDSTFGMGLNVDWQSVATLDSACETLVGAERKRIGSITIDSPALVDAWLQQMCDYACCWALREGDVYRLVPDAPVPLSACWGTGVWGVGVWGPDIWSTGGLPLTDESNCIYGDFQYKPLSQAATVVEVTYTDTSVKPWREQKVTVYAPGVLDGSVDRRYSRVSRPGIQRHSEAYRYAVERLNDELLCDLSVPVNVFDDGLEVQAGDVRLLTRSQIGVISKPFRIVGTKLLEPGRWGLSLREYDPAKYSSEVVTGPSILDTPWPSASHPPRVNSLTLVEDIYFQQGAGLWLSRIVATWVMPTWPLTDSFRIEVWSSGNLIETGTATATSTNYATSPLKEGLTYEVRVYTISVAGVASAAVAQSIVTTGKLARPGDIITFDGFEVGGETRLTWSYLDALGQKLDTDLAATEIRYLTVTAAVAAGSTAAAWAAASASALRVPYPQSHLYTKAIPAGVWRIMAKALDSVSTSVFQYGQESVNAIFKDVSVTSDTAAFVAATYDFTTPLLSNMVVVPQGWVTSFGESWNSLFTSAMNSYTNSLYTYHMAGTSALLTEIHDFGASLTGDWFGSFTYSNLGGTAVAYIELSSGPDNAKTVLGATNATPIVLNITAHGWNTGDEVVVASVGGNTAANGTRLVTVIDADHVSLQDQFGNNVAGSGSYTSGGTATRWVWAAYNTATIKSTARYGRMRISTTGTVLVTTLPEMRINVVARSEGGTVAVASSGPTIVTFANHYNAAVSAQVTARGAGFANGVYDRVEISGARGILAGECLRFDGTTGDYVEAPTIAATQLTTFTVECWAKVEVYGATTYTLVSKRSQVAAAFPYLYQLIIVQGHKPRFDIFTNSGAQRCGSPQDCPLGRWFHMAGTYDNGTKVMTLYVDGEIVASLTASGSFVAPDYTLGIGIVPISQSVAARTEPHEGLIDEVRIWNTVRTQAQIKALKDTPATGSESGLVALYHFDSLSGNVATDSTSNANHGTVTGAEWRPLDGMDVYLFDAAGTQISGTAAWAFSGV